MIHVDRKRVRPPRSLRAQQALEAREEARRFFERPEPERRQVRFSFDHGVYAGSPVQGALTELFHGKCAFCESVIGLTSPVETVHLRPPQGALDLDGGFAPDHYWWLAYEWENLYASCPSCARVRGSRFPVEGERAAPGTKGAGLRAERPLLLDPCRDRPEEHLLFLDDGTVVSDDERGRVTCEMFDLNRPPLVELRRDAVATVTSELDAGARLEALTDPSRPFAGLRRQLAAERLGTDRVATRVVPERSKGEVRDDFKRRQAEHEAYGLEDPSRQEGYFSHARYVERVELRNFRAIEELDLRLDLEAIAATAPQESADHRAPWLMLLGENGLGKTTVLQGICLALLDERVRDGLGLDASEYVRSGAERATVRVHLTGTPEPIELVARAGSRRFEGDSSLRALVLGYGATRLLPTERHPVVEPATVAGARARVDNLFDPFVPVGDTTGWLLSLPEEEFDFVALGLRQLLMLADDEMLVRDLEHGRVVAEVGGTRVRLEALSAGYQSVIALATDVMKVVLREWRTPTLAEGIVVVDELGAHLHPRWRMRIVEALRGVFPRVQFLASTHDPLCLRGLADGEIVVLRQDSEKRVVALADLPPPSSMRVDQLLASEHFGLGSTVDPELDALFAEYYLLRAKRRPNARERARLEELRDQLEGQRLLGTTRRERLIYEATDDFLAREVDLTDRDDREQLRDETKQRILAAWKGAAR